MSQMVINARVLSCPDDNDNIVRACIRSADGTDFFIPVQKKQSDKRRSPATSRTLIVRSPTCLTAISIHQHYVADVLNPRQFKTNNKKRVEYAWCPRWYSHFCCTCTHCSVFDLIATMV